MVDWLAALPRRRTWWFALAALAVFLEGAALYYQYVLDYLPCVVCIHVRMILAVGLVVWIVAGLTCHKASWRWAANGLSLVLGAVFIERSWNLLAVEYGWIFGGCDMSLGLPSWIAIDRWMPWLFKIHEPCGVTPFVLGRISMAEALMALSVVMMLLFMLTTVLGAIRRPSPATA